MGFLLSLDGFASDIRNHVSGAVGLRLGAVRCVWQGFFHARAVTRGVLPTCSAAPGSLAPGPRWRTRVIYPSAALHTQSSGLGTALPCRCLRYRLGCYYSPRPIKHPGIPSARFLPSTSLLRSRSVVSPIPLSLQVAIPQPPNPAGAAMRTGLSA